jgi:hypothetical protein
VQLFSFLAAYRVLMVWVYDRPGSLLVAMLMHASLTASTRILQPLDVAGMRAVTYGLVLAAVAPHCRARDGQQRATLATNAPAARGVKGHERLNRRIEAQNSCQALGSRTVNVVPASVDEFT